MSPLEGVLIVLSLIGALYLASIFAQWRKGK